LRARLRVTAHGALVAPLRALVTQPFAETLTAFAFAKPLAAFAGALAVFTKTLAFSAMRASLLGTRARAKTLGACDPLVAFAKTLAGAAEAVIAAVRLPLIVARSRIGPLAAAACAGGFAAASVVLREPALAFAEPCAAARAARLLPRTRLAPSTARLAGATLTTAHTQSFASELSVTRGMEYGRDLHEIDAYAID
jgi:hypothetical protein